MTDRTVVVLPGASSGPSVPQLFLPMMAALRRGAAPRPVEWDALADLDRLPRSAWDSWIGDRARTVLEDLHPSSAIVLGKSLGTLAAGLVADLGLPAVWITPLLRDAAVLGGLRRTASPVLLVGGTGDPEWDGDAARSLTEHVLELPGADHGLFVPGPLRRSVAHLAELVDATERFLDEVVWPVGR